MTVSRPQRIASDAKRAKENAQALSGIRLYTLTELEGVLGVSHRTLQIYVMSGRLKAAKIGGKWKVSEQNLQRFINGDEGSAGGSAGGSAE